jgi:hypothetical protein
VDIPEQELYKQLDVLEETEKPMIALTSENTAEQPSRFYRFVAVVLLSSLEMNYLNLDFDLNSWPVRCLVVVLSDTFFLHDGDVWQEEDPPPYVSCIVSMWTL